MEAKTGFSRSKMEIDAFENQCGRRIMRIPSIAKKTKKWLIEPFLIEQITPESLPKAQMTRVKSSNYDPALPRSQGKMGKRGEDEEQQGGGT